MRNLYVYFDLIFFTLTKKFKEVEAEGPFTAYSFFTVDNSMLTAALANILTYLIILIQFDLCKGNAMSNVSNESN